ncbi:MAG: HAD hydrolase family protein [Chloroflexi bacterium]|nr:HAD hydrolase family protein [Chloroflexota bacterium]
MAVLARLEELNHQALIDPLVPAITLCTGRQAPYVEMLAQMIGCFLPCIFEHGCGLFFPTAFRYAFHPSLGPDYSARLATLRAALEEPLLRPGRAFVQPGKEASMTLYPLEGTPVAELEAAAAVATEPLRGAFTIMANLNGVELRPAGMDKGVGMRWLADEVGITLAEVVGVGDTETDLVFLEQAGLSAAPANAVADVRATVDYVAVAPFGQGLLEVVEMVMDENRAAALFSR